MMTAMQKLLAVKALPSAMRFVFHGLFFVLALLLARHAVPQTAAESPVSTEAPAATALEAPPETPAAIAEPETAPSTPVVTDLTGGKSAFLRWVGEEVAAPVAEIATQQQSALAHLQEEVAQSRSETVALTQEVAGLRTELTQLRETLDLLVRQVVADLEQENKALRDSVADVQVQDKADQMLKQLRHQPSAFPIEPPDEPKEPPVELTLEVVDEWGRTSEDAAALGNQASTLKGMVGLVPEGGARADLEQLGQDLRAQYAEYDNINIEVFDNREAAERFKESQTASPAHRVLSISKHAASGRDTIVVFIDGMAIAVQ